MGFEILGLKAISAIFIGLISGAVTFVSRHWVEALIRGKFDSNLSVVKSGWKGTINQRRGDIKTFNVELVLESKFNIVYGKLTYDSRILKCVGGFEKDRYLSLNYKNEISSMLQHGTVALKLSGNNEKLSGDFVGVGPVSEKIVIGTIELSKVS